MEDQEEAPTTLKILAIRKELPPDKTLLPGKEILHIRDRQEAIHLARLLLSSISNRLLTPVASLEMSHQVGNRRRP